MESGTVLWGRLRGGRVQGRAVVSRFIGPGCGGCKEAQMGRTLPLRNRNTQTQAHTQRHTRFMFTLQPWGCFKRSNRCACMCSDWAIEEGCFLPVVDQSLRGSQSSTICPNWSILITFLLFMWRIPVVIASWCVFVYLMFGGFQDERFPCWADLVSTTEHVKMSERLK